VDRWEALAAEVEVVVALAANNGEVIHKLVGMEIGDKPMDMVKKCMVTVRLVDMVPMAAAWAAIKLVVKQAEEVHLVVVASEVGVEVNNEDDPAHALIK
jgi:hypothetical protein